MSQTLFNDVKRLYAEIVKPVEFKFHITTNMAEHQLEIEEAENDPEQLLVIFKVGIHAKSES